MNEQRSEEKVLACLTVEDGYLCEAGCIDMGLKRGDPRAQGIVVEMAAPRSDIEIRGLTQNTVREIAKHIRGRVRIRIELLENADGR